MHLISVNRGQAQVIEGAGKTGKTGIFKHPAHGEVQISVMGLEGDAIVDTHNHGGADQAVYIYGVADYDWWSRELGRMVEPGTFGENLTIAGLESATFQVGDRLHIGEVLLEVSAPRIPCSTLAARMGDPGFTKRFLAAERPGLLCRVLREGNVRTGDEVRFQPAAGPTVSILEMYRTHSTRNRMDAATLRRHLAAPIAIRDRIEKEERLRRLLEAGQA